MFDTDKVSLYQFLRNKAAPDHVMHSFEQLVAAVNSSTPPRLEIVADNKDADWSAAQEKLVKKEYEADILTVKALASKHGRTPRAIYAKMTKLDAKRKNKA